MLSSLRTNEPGAFWGLMVGLVIGLIRSEEYIQNSSQKYVALHNYMILYTKIDCLICPISASLKNRRNQFRVWLGWPKQCSIHRIIIDRMEKHSSLFVFISK